MRCLVVDDNQALAENLAEILVDWGHVVEVETSGPAALRALKMGFFDFLLCDFRMPGMDGATVIREAMVMQPGVCAVLFSGFMDRSDLAGVSPEHILAILPKPIPISELKRALDRALV